MWYWLSPGICWYDTPGTFFGPTKKDMTHQIVSPKQTRKKIMLYEQQTKPITSGKGRG